MRANVSLNRVPCGFSDTSPVRCPPATARRESVLRPLGIGKHQWHRQSRGRVGSHIRCTAPQDPMSIHQPSTFPPTRPPR